MNEGLTCVIQCNMEVRYSIRLLQRRNQNVGQGGLILEKNDTVS